MHKGLPSQVLSTGHQIFDLIVSLDRVIRTMRKTGEDMHLRYKETSRGGLATNVLEVPVNIIEC